MKFQPIRLTRIKTHRQATRIWPSVGSKVARSNLYYTYMINKTDRPGPFTAGTSLYASPVVRVLIAHRERRARAALRHALQMNCPSIVLGEAEHMEETFDLLRVWQPDVLLIDWDLVRQRGERWLRQVKQAVPDLTLLVLGHNEDRERALSWGAKDFIDLDGTSEQWVGTLREHCT